MKKIMAAASFDKQKYFLDPEYDAIPQGIKDEVIWLKNLCALLLSVFIRKAAMCILKP